MTDTIFALSSGHPPSGVSMIRLSGPATPRVLRSLSGRALPDPRLMQVRALRDPGDKDNVLDRAMIVWFPAPGSFTGEDSAELHVHGGPAVVAAVLNVLSRQPGLRLAGAGEFSRRAFDNGKMDLSGAEALSDLIAAETELQRRQALGQLGGRLAAQCIAWQDGLKRALANVEANIDFSDEDLPDRLDEEARRGVCAIAAAIDDCLSDARAGERIRDGITVAIVGPPNVGKSTLLNALAGRDAAITSEHAGTTRDVVQVHMDLGGYPVTLFDTAGLRETEDTVEREGIRRARDVAEKSDIRLILLDGDTWADRELFENDFAGNHTLVVVNKIDVLDPPGVPGAVVEDGDEAGEGNGYRARDGYGAGEGNGYRASDRDSDPILISAKTRYGLGALLARLEQNIARQWTFRDGVAITRIRHRNALEACQAHLERALSGVGSELWAEDLRLAMRTLGQIVGQVGVEDVLDVIFSEFCIGK